MAERTRKQQIEEMLALDPDDSFLRYALAMENVSEGNDDQAILQLLELTRLDPTYVPAYQQAASALLRAGREEDARAILLTGIPVAKKAGNDHAAAEMTDLLRLTEDTP